MKRLFFVFSVIILAQICAYAECSVYGENGLFGLKNENNQIIVKAGYKKLIRLGETAWIAQRGNKFGLIDNDGRILVEPKFSRAERVLGKFAKFSKGEKYGIFDEKGFEILPVEYSSIDLLFGGMFLTSKNFKYGIADFNGQIILDNIFDDLYMPNPKKLVITYNGQSYEIENVNKTELMSSSYFGETDFKISEIISKPAVTTGYYSVSLTNYLLKILSSISPAYEQTVDELMFSQGADAAGVIMKFSWVPKFPIVYAKKYYNNVKAPNNGPLGNVKTNLKKHLNQQPES